MSLEEKQDHSLDHVWINRGTGEVIETTNPCLLCAQTDADREAVLRQMEMERRKLLAKISKLENDIERDKVKHRDREAWERILERWRETFPDQKIRTTSHKSARATAVFMRLQTLAESDMPDKETVDLFLQAIAGARKLPYVVFGKRRPTGSKSDLAIDLADIASEKDDRRFDALVEAGAPSDVGF